MYGTIFLPFSFLSYHKNPRLGSPKHSCRKPLPPNGLRHLELLLKHCIRWYEGVSPSNPTKEAEALFPKPEKPDLQPTPTPSACADNCGILPPCAPLAVPYVPFQQTGSQRYNQLDALSQGTLFPGLNLPFRAKPMATPVAQSAMTELQALEFVVQELALYLDTHPDDAEAFALFQQFTALEKAANADYAKANGPLLREQAALDKTYTWLKSAWPWSGEEGGAK